MTTRRMLASIFAASCGVAGTTAKAPLAPLDPPPPAAGTVLGAFGMYVARPSVDAFPNAPVDAGWATGSFGSGTAIEHFIVLDAAPNESAAQAIARRGDVTPTLPPNARLLYQGSSAYHGALDWSMISIVVEAKPTLAASDIASCELTSHPEIIINSNGDNESNQRPYIKVTWTPAAAAKIQALVDIERAVKLYLALGDDVVADWSPGYARDGVGVVELELPGPNQQAAQGYADRNRAQLCPKLSGP